MTAKNNNQVNTFEQFFIQMSFGFQIKISVAVNYIIELKSFN